MTDETSQNEEQQKEQMEKIVAEGKNFGMYLKEKKYFSALKEFFKLLGSVYKRFIKGKYVTVKGKKIPLVAVLTVVLLLFVGMMPAGENSTEKQKQSTETADTVENTQLKEKEDLNTYNQDGIKVYGLVKCENAVCGYLENGSDNDISRILISINFTDKSGAVIYEGGAEATAMVAKSRSRFKIPAEGEFDAFHLTDVTVEK